MREVVGLSAATDVKVWLPNSRPAANDPIANIRLSFHTTRMKWLILLITLALSACSNVENTFEVEDEQQAVVAATLILCGEETPLRRTGGRLTVSKAIQCEGSGHITLRYASGSEKSCTVGYVTPALKQSIYYRATEKGCTVWNHFVS